MSLNDLLKYYKKNLLIGNLKKTVNYLVSSEKAKPLRTISTRYADKEMKKNLTILRNTLFFLSLCSENTFTNKIIFCL
jgi:hypothetical protein